MSEKTIPREKQLEIMAFFLKTSIPRMIKERSK